MRMNGLKEFAVLVFVKTQTGQWLSKAPVGATDLGLHQFFAEAWESGTVLGVGSKVLKNRCDAKGEVEKRRIEIKNQKRPVG